MPKPSALDYVSKVLLPALSLVAYIVAEIKNSSPGTRSLLLGVTVVLVLFSLYGMAKSRIEAFIEARRDQQTTRNALPELRRLASSFAEFVDTGRSDTFHYIADNELCQGNGQLVNRLSLPPISLWYHFSQYFSQRANRHSSRPSELGVTMMEFHHLVGSYNNLCVAAVFERLPQDLQHLVTPKAKSSLNGFQQRFVMFLKEYEDFVKTLRECPAFEGVWASFVRPKPL